MGKTRKFQKHFCTTRLNIVKLDTPLPHHEMKYKPLSDPSRNNTKYVGQSTLRCQKYAKTEKNLHSTLCTV